MAIAQAPFSVDWLSRRCHATIICVSTSELHVWDTDYIWLHMSGNSVKIDPHAGQKQEKNFVGLYCMRAILVLKAAIFHFSSSLGSCYRQ